MLSVAFAVRRSDGRPWVPTAVHGTATCVQRLLLAVDDGLPAKRRLIGSVGKLFDDLLANVSGEDGYPPE